MRVPLTLACGDYDRTALLARGAIAPDGVDLTYLALPGRGDLLPDGAARRVRRPGGTRRRVAETAAGVSMLPWAYAEAELTRRVMGQDFWTHGLAGNEATLSTFIRHSYEQGLVKEQRSPASLFAAETREAFVI